MFQSGNIGYEHAFKDRKVNLNESSIQNYSTVCSALGTIKRLGTHKGKIQWKVYGLKNQDATIRSIYDEAKPDKIQLHALSEKKSLKDVTWKNYNAFIVPDFADKSLNFVALSAMWLGIPTILSSQSVLGKFLLDLGLPQ